MDILLCYNYKIQENKFYKGRVNLGLKLKLIRKHSLSKKGSCKEFLGRITLNVFDAEATP